VPPLPGGKTNTAGGATAAPVAAPAKTAPPLPAKAKASVGGPPPLPGGEGGCPAAAATTAAVATASQGPPGLSPQRRKRKDTGSWGVVHMESPSRTSADVSEPIIRECMHMWLHRRHPISHHPLCGVLRTLQSRSTEVVRAPR
jgi:hypothetical protein